MTRHIQVTKLNNYKLDDCLGYLRFWAILSVSTQNLHRSLCLYDSLGLLFG